MIGTATTEKQLASIDSATALGQLADDALLAVLTWRETNEMDDQAVERLNTFAAWLDRLIQNLADPISVARPSEFSRSFPGLDSFGPVVPSAVLGLRSAETTESELEMLQQMRMVILAIAARQPEMQGLDEIQRIFGAISRSMLSTVEALKAPSARATWPSISAF